MKSTLRARQLSTEHVCVERTQFKDSVLVDRQYTKEIEAMLESLHEKQKMLMAHAESPTKKTRATKSGEWHTCFGGWDGLKTLGALGTGVCWCPKPR